MGKKTRLGIWDSVLQFENELATQKLMFQTLVPYVVELFGDIAKALGVQI